MSLKSYTTQLVECGFAADKTQELPRGFQDLSKVVQHGKVQIIGCVLPDLITRSESGGEKNRVIMNDHGTDAVRNTPGDEQMARENRPLPASAQVKSARLPPGHTAEPGRQQGSVCKESQSSGSRSWRGTEPAGRFCCWSSSSWTLAGKRGAAGGRREN